MLSQVFIQINIVKKRKKIHLQYFDMCCKTSWVTNLRNFKILKFQQHGKGQGQSKGQKVNTLNNTPIFYFREI